MDKEMLDLLKDGTMKGKDIWVRVYDEKSGKKGWIRIIDLLEGLTLQSN